jgi:hypothetical protein
LSTWVGGDEASIITEPTFKSSLQQHRAHQERDVRKGVVIDSQKVKRRESSRICGCVLIHESWIATMVIKMQIKQVVTQFNTSPVKEQKDKSATPYTNTNNYLEVEVKVFFPCN